MEKYEKVETLKPVIPENELRINRKTPISKYLYYVLAIFKEDNFKEVILRGMGSDAISKLVILAEVVKHKVRGVRQINDIHCEEIVDRYEPLEEGLDEVVIQRRNTVMTIRLTREEVQVKGYGY